MSMHIFVAEIRIFPFNFAPNGWAKCDGQLLAITSNTALFSLIGTMYGGNGQQNFALPDLRDRSPNFWGQGAGLSLYHQGQMGGSQSLQLIQAEIPAHNHLMNCNNGTGTTPVPTGNFFAGPAPEADRGPLPMYNTGTAGPTANMAPLSVSGGDIPHNNMMPYLTLNICIALQGLFPPRP